MDRNSPVTAIKGIGKKTGELFESLGIHTLEDLIMYFPSDYINYPAECEVSEAEPDKRCAVAAYVRSSPAVNTRSRMKTAVLDIFDGKSSLRLLWFRRPYIRSIVKPARSYIFYGKVIIKDNIFMMEQPDVYSPEEYSDLRASLQPVYPLTKGVTSKLIRKSVKAALELADMEPDYLAEDIRIRCGLCEYNYAVENIHFPADEKSCIEARKRLVFDEFFFFILAMHIAGGDGKKAETDYVIRNDFAGMAAGKLPYDLTGAQKRVLSEIMSDMGSGYAMQRLLQGDVGSGKTAVAFIAMAAAAKAGYQAAIMAPTEVLARQHYNKLKEFAGLCVPGCPVILLTGALNPAQKKEAHRRIGLGGPALIVGTHALFQEKVIYSNLALVITDEQHRFGVDQRSYFAGKGISPHILVMSATPIPRTLAIILYGNMDISVIDEVPARRKPIKNCVVGTDYRNAAYKFIFNEIKNGHQAYIICPLVDESELLEGENVLDYSEKLRNIFPESVKIGTLHGRMKPAEKTKVMDGFLAGDIDILVSTTVVEVGVDVPSATVMMVENADHFGLAQLHQLRGRVGRGEDQSYCILINSSGSKNERLETLKNSNDGFYIASEDLKLRGPGDFFGIRQSGESAFKIADVYQDADILAMASYEASVIEKEDPDFSDESHDLLYRKITRYIGNENEKILL